MKKLLRNKLALSVMLATGLSAGSQAAPLDLDTSFSGDGMVTANYGTGTKSYFTDVEMTPDDKIVAVGYAQAAGNNYNILIAKYNVDGTLDNSFGTSGTVNLAIEANNRAEGLAIQPDGKLLVAGHSLGASGKWKLYVKRFNTDGSEDLSFTTYTYSPSYSTGIVSGVRDVRAKDIALTTDGKILISLQEHYTSFQTGSGFDKLDRSKMVRLQENGSLDTTFGTNGFTDKVGAGTSYSYEDNKFALSSTGDIYIPGGRREAFYSQNIRTMTISKYNSNGIAQIFSGSTAGWNRRENTAANPAAAYNQQDQLNSSLVLPNGNIASVGCSEQSGTYFSSRIQLQNSNGNFVTAFDTDGVVDSDMINSSYRIEHCFRDVTYHPSVGLIAVGGIKNGVWTTHGSLYISAVNADTGASIGVSRTGTVNQGYLTATAITSAGKIVSVGYVDPVGGAVGHEAAVMMMQGAPLPVAINNLGPLSFTDITSADLSVQQQSAISNVVITPSAPLTAKVYGGSASINNTVQSNPLTLSDGDNLSLIHTSASTENTKTSTAIVVNNGTGFHRNNQTWSVGDTFAEFNSTTFVADTTPDAFTLTAITNAPLNSFQISAAADISGINSATAISVSSGSHYSVNGAAYTNVAGTVDNGDTVTVRHASANTFSAIVTSTLTVGGVSTAFTSTTEAQDTTPSAFSFSAKTAVLRNTVQVSDAISIAGINDASAISITGGLYSVNGGGFTNASGTVVNGDSVEVRHDASGSFATPVTSTLTIGGVVGSFTSTTEVADTTPHPFVLQPSGLSSPAIPGAPSNSETITVSEINSATAISIVNGTYSINGGTYVSANGTVNNGDTVRVRHTASNSFATQVTSTLTIGGVSSSFSSTTEAQDTRPNPFSFGMLTGLQSLSATLISPPVSIVGINSAAPISVTDGEYSINGGAYTSVAGTVINGSIVRVRHVTSNLFSRQKSTTLNVGGAFANYLSTTIAQDTTPDGFSFGPRVDGQQRSVQVVSGSITVAGINSATAISVTGGEYQINNGAFTSATGMVNAGDNVVLRQTTASGFSSLSRTDITIGGLTKLYETRTMDRDITPDTFNVVAQTNVELNTVITSAEFTVTGINDSADISITDGEYNLNNAGFTSSVGPLENVDPVVIRHKSSSSHSTSVSTEVDVEGVTSIFTSTTKAVASSSSSSKSGGGAFNFAWLLLLMGLVGFKKTNLPKNNRD
jgi:uncharacterized delta-60 repeat protein